MFAQPIRQPLVSLDATLSPTRLETLRNNFSGLAFSKDHLWIGGDEGTLIERLNPTPDGNFNHHRRYDLADILDLPGGKLTEMDVEGLCFTDGFLWVVGSHSLRRKKPDPTKSAKENRERLKVIEQQLNRYTLARIPIEANGDAVTADGARKAVRLRADSSGDSLLKHLSQDEYLAHACGVPSKENGLDIEGLAVSGNRVYLGLRGPVLRGRAIILELETKDKGDELGMPSFKRHFLDLHGLGVRDLMIVDRDLYILTGPTMALDGPVFLFRWPKALDVKEEAFVERKDLKLLLTIAFGDGVDHAEGMTLLPGTKQLLTCYDTPAPQRVPKPNQVKLDVFQL
jgi:hypothetical protein